MNQSPSLPSCFLYTTFHIPKSSRIISVIISFGTVFCLHYLKTVFKAQYWMYWIIIPLPWHFFSSGVSDYLVLLVWLFVIPMSNWSPVFSGRQHLEECPLNLLTCSRLSCLLPILAQLASCSLYHLPESFYSYSRMFFFLDIRYHFTGPHPLDFWKRICFLFILHA